MEEETHLIKTVFNGDPNLGLYGFATDKYAFLGPLSEKDSKTVEKVLKVKAITNSIAGTRFVGIFAIGNSKGILLPHITTENELKDIKQKFKEEGIKINIEILKDKQTALGNLITCNDHACIISKSLEKHKKLIEEVLEVPVTVLDFEESDMIGSYTIATNKGFLLNMYATEEDYEKVRQALKVEGDIGTVNFGSPFVKSGIIANSQGVIIGRETTGPEIARIDEALGFLD